MTSVKVMTAAVVVKMMIFNGRFLIFLGLECAVCLTTSAAAPHFLLCHS